MSASHEDVLAFWFGELDQQGLASKETTARWFRKSDAFDEEIRSRFGALHAEIARGEREDWLAAPRSRLAYVIVLDQFSRNMFRGTSEMFASDAKALAAAKLSIDAGDDRRHPDAERTFLYMPLMHAESLAEQDCCIELFRALADEAAASGVVAPNNTEYAIKHRDIVARFGRFPHRNELLGRTSTEEETAFLKEPGSSF